LKEANHACRAGVRDDEVAEDDEVSSIDEVDANEVKYEVKNEVTDEAKYVELVVVDDDEGVTDSNNNAEFDNEVEDDEAAIEFDNDVEDDGASFTVYHGIETVNFESALTPTLIAPGL